MNGSLFNATELSMLQGTLKMGVGDRDYYFNLCRALEPGTVPNTPVPFGAHAMRVSRASVTFRSHH